LLCFAELLWANNLSFTLAGLHRNHKALEDLLTNGGKTKKGAAGGKKTKGGGKKGSGEGDEGPGKKVIKLVNNNNMLPIVSQKLRWRTVFWL
jgi:hypothetical protein